jgi:hypothetical protein
VAKKGVLQSEYEQQEKTLRQLPAGFKYPLFNGWQAIQSQRKSGYKTTARAAREIVDNSIEAGADNIWVVFDLINPDQLKPHQRKNTVTAVAFIDDGPGMVHHSNDKSMLRYSLSWGGGSHFDNPRLIGRFGFGLPNSSVNQTQLTEVYTKTSTDEHWNKAVLDIRKEKIPPSGEVNSSEVETSELPTFVKDFLKKKKISLKTGTVVVWQQPDRLTVNQRATLREHLEHDFQIVYRGLIDRVKLFVDSDEPVFKVDPTFLDPDGWLYLDPKKGGANCYYDETLFVKHYLEEDSGQPRLELIGPEKGKDPMTGFTYDLSLEEAKRHVAEPPAGQRAVGISALHARVSQLPYPTFIKQEKKKIESDAGRRFEIRKRTRGISFVRSGREIDTRDVFPKDNREETGTWPLLQSYAYYWALEVKFDPGVDDVMGIGHDKQTVEPISDFWKVLTKALVPEALTRATKTRKELGQTEEKRRREAKDADAPAVEAANQATKLDPPVIPGSAKTKRQQQAAEGSPGVNALPVDSAPFDSAPIDSAPIDSAPIDSAPIDSAPIDSAPVDSAPVNSAPADSPPVDRGAVNPPPIAEPTVASGGEPSGAQVLDLEPTGLPPASLDSTKEVPDESETSQGRFAIKFFNAEGGVFMEPIPGINGQVIAKINRLHPWFDAYANPASILEARNACNLLLLSLASAEIRASDEEQAFLEGLRCDNITPFLRKAARLLKNIIPTSDEEKEE